FRYEEGFSTLFYAIRIHGNFPGLTTRAIPKLFPPNPPLSEALKQQVKFSFQNIEGTLVAFRCPAWVKGFGSPRRYRSQAFRAISAIGVKLINLVDLHLQRLATQGLSFRNQLFP